MSQVEPAASARRLVEGYEALFDERLRAAHRGCLDHGRTLREDRWPTPLDVLAYAKMFGVDPAELGALFGLILQARNGQQVWVDLMRGPVHPLAAGLKFSHAQAVALGWGRAAAELILSEDGS